MDYFHKPERISPRIIIHGGAGNITPENLPVQSYNAYREALIEIVGKSNTKLLEPGARAIDIATYAVSLLEKNLLFNAGRGAVYTTAGTHELEASVMVSNGYRKRGVGVMGVKKAKSPIKLAKEMLVRGELADGGGAQGHCQLHGETCDRLAEEWGLDLAKPSYFWTRRRWDEHRRGLGLPHDDESYEEAKEDADRGHACKSSQRAGGCDALDSFESTPSESDTEDERNEESCISEIGWDGKEYLPQGTVGAVVLDSFGTLCVATSTGGLTNKLPGRIGDTPTLGAGFWSEEWFDSQVRSTEVSSTALLSQLFSSIGDCLPSLSGYTPLPAPTAKGESGIRAVAMSGTGNGDSFLRTNAVRTAAAIARYSSKSTRAESGRVSLQQAVNAVAGPHGQLQRSAGERWHVTGEGEGGIIGIELVEGEGKIVFDFNCGGMFHAWVDDEGKKRFELFQDGPRPPPS
ncbi:isoaspartyl peptidase L-asparaginase [Lecanosticta acicola]|uniref:Isoaspartyl peptidase L-asparaginase n=1 Tax=Lecanosticta acicola TaxID=111012 RepID=A0AAI8YWM1_9PEZI|nr:isoaspartyl peptidase L-asparaginase [Lecanosticta acicola]